MNFGNLDRERLKLLKSLGFAPSHIFDVGASNGSWTWAVHDIFSGAQFHLFEPLADEHASYREGLNNLLRAGVQAIVHAIAVGNATGTTTIGVDEAAVGSSVLVGRVSEVFQKILTVPLTTIDDFIARGGMPVPQLIKMDTQGAELSVLEGATETLKRVEVLLLETWLVRGYGPRTPLFMELANWLAARDFFLFDIGDCYRDANGILTAQDFFFVREPSSITGLDSPRSFRPPIQPTDNP